MSKHINILFALLLIAGPAFGQLPTPTTSSEIRLREGTNYWYAPLSTLPGLLPSGTSGQTLRHDGSAWVANSVLFNDGTNVGVGNSGSFLTSGRLEVNKSYTNTTDGNLVLTGSLPVFTIRNSSYRFALASNYQSSDILTLLGNPTANENPTSTLMSWQANGDVKFFGAKLSSDVGRVNVGGGGSSFGATEAPTGVGFYASITGGQRFRIEGSSGLSYMDFYTPNSGSNRNFSFATSYIGPGDFCLLRSDAAGGTPGTVIFGANGDGLGIGTGTPSQMLDVNGAFRLRGALYDVANSAGAAGKNLSNTGSGVQWKTAFTATGAGAASSGDSPTLNLNNTTATTGKNWQFHSANAGGLSIGNATLGDVIGFNGTTGAATVYGELTLLNAVSFSGDIAPTNISGTTNNYAPTGFSTASTLLQTNSSGAIVTGIAGGIDGWWLTWHNTGSNNLIFRNENALSTAANRLLLGGGDLTLRADGTAGFRYDATASRWRLVYITSFSSGAKVYEFITGTANFQLDIPAGAKAADITAVGAGGGGGSGRKGAAASVRCGGGGGASGGYYHIMYPLEGSDAAIFYVNVGTGGAGGASVTTNSTGGNNGDSGGETDVRVDGTATTDRIFRAGAGSNGAGGTASSGTGGAASIATQIASSAGATASTVGGNSNATSTSSNGTAGGGGGGGGVTTANTPGNGVVGGFGAQSLQDGGVANGGTAAAISKNRDTGGGGGGGNGSHTGNAIAGGAGRRGGGGGGGGGSTDSVGNSGAGGAGGDGYVKIVFFF